MRDNGWMTIYFYLFFDLMSVQILGLNHSQVLCPPECFYLRTI